MLTINIISDKYDKTKSLAGRLWVVTADEENFFEVPEWIPTTHTGKVKTTTWEIKSQDQLDTFKTKTSDVLQKVDLKINKKYSGSYAFYLEALLDGTSEMAGIHVRGDCEAKISLAKWSKQENADDQSELNYGHNVYIHLETEGLNGDLLTLELFSKKDDAKVIQSVSERCINGELQAKFTTMPCFTAKAAELEEFYIKIKNGNGIYINDTSHNDKPIAFSIKNKTVIPKFEVPTNQTALKVGKPDVYVASLGVVAIKWLDKDGKEIPKKTIAGTVFSDVVYGEKVMLEVTTKGLEDGRNVEVEITADQGSTFKKNIAVAITGNKGKTDPFLIPITEYDESIEKYITNATIVDNSKIKKFQVKATYKFTTIFKAEEDLLKPYTYRRNYEELIGLFDTNNSNSKSLTTNYENQFIGYNTEIQTIVDDFIKFIKDESKSKDDITKEVEKQAKALWDKAIAKVQAGALDDRPLYWARNKMQSWLKRHPIYKKGIDFETSIITKGSELDKLIIIFEEKSRNYKGIDFKGATKKILVTGFDPFLLNSIDHKYKDYYNILQSNPSGVVALTLANTNNLGANIQTMMFPVRYTDFDGNNNPTTGQGEGVVEKYIKDWIGKVDMIITVSQALPDDYHIDVFATATRGGGDENMNYTRAKDKSVSASCPETFVTKLPIQFTQGSSKAIFYGNHFITEQDEIDFDNGNGDLTKEQKCSISNYPQTKIFSGPGGNYLSNEIFYRVALMRETLKPSLKTGHFHISKIQNASKYTKEDLDSSKIKDLLNNVKQALKEGIKGI